MARMANDGHKKGEIQPPKANVKADIARATAKAALGAVPLAGSFLAEAAELTLPNPSERDRQRWEHEITGGVNSLDGRVGKMENAGTQSITLSGGAAAAARYLIERCPYSRAMP
jgi:hypothetical protein